MNWKKIFLFFWHIPRNVCIWCIKLYQKTLSPDHGWFKSMFPYGYCKFYPTCSNYGIQSLQKDGFLKGSIKTIWRILRCNPWNKGGEDQA